MIIWDGHEIGEILRSHEKLILLFFNFIRIFEVCHVLRKLKVKSQFLQTAKSSKFVCACVTKWQKSQENLLKNPDKMVQKIRSHEKTNIIFCGNPTLFLWNANFQIWMLSTEPLTIPLWSPQILGLTSIPIFSTCVF